MPSREELELWAAAVNVTSSNYPNDSKLEQAILFAASNLTAGGATVQTPSAKSIKNAASGKKNV